MRHEIPVEDDVLETLRAYAPAPVALMETMSEIPRLSRISNLSEVFWPAELKAEAFHGLAGEWVRMVEPHTEADPAALLVQLLVAFGSLIGRGPHYRVEADRHFTNLFAVIVGRTAKGRKGTSWGQVKAIAGNVDEAWLKSRVLSGLSSGEGLIWAVRDEIMGFARGGRGCEPEEQITDPGVADKRLLIVEGELARALQNCERQGNILSSVLRDSWDTGELSTLTKNSPARASGAHISVIGHITRDELRRLLTDTATANGFANRFLWVCSARSKCLPDGGSLDAGDLRGLITRFQDAAQFARGVGLLTRDAQASAIWPEVYSTLSEGKPGLLGAVTSRGECQVLRLMCIYALLDKSSVVRAEHLMAALAVWDYCEDSARFIFGNSLGDAVADEILRALRERPDGLTRSDIRDHFGRNKRSGEIDRALNMLQEYGRAHPATEKTGQGRPAERWRAATGTT